MYRKIDYLSKAEVSTAKYEAKIYRLYDGGLYLHVTPSDIKSSSRERIPDLMKTFTGNISAYQKNLHPVEFAAIIHKELVTIHPFIDGNGRAARLLMNLALL